MSFFPTDVGDGRRRELSRLGVRVLHGDLEDHLRQTGTHYDVVVISRPHNYGRFGPVVRSAQPQAAVVYDAEALYYRRTELLVALTEDGPAREALRLEAAATRCDEEAYFADADLAVCISEDEAALARSIAGAGPVEVIPAQLVGPQWTPAAFADRRDVILVASWLAGDESPNVDGFRWFMEEVMPPLSARLPWVRVRVTGVDPPQAIRDYEGPNVQFVGRVHDLAGFYDGSRVAISPIRYGAGVKIKTIEALQYGIPTVATGVGGEGIETFGTGALRVTDDPLEFADTVAGLADDAHAWARQRRRLEALHEHWSVAAPGTTWRSVVDRALGASIEGESTE